jgi:hypothetical protein
LHSLASRPTLLQAFTYLWARADEAIARLATTARMVAAIGLRMVESSVPRSASVLKPLSTLSPETRVVVARKREPASLLGARSRRCGSLSGVMETAALMP